MSKETRMRCSGCGYTFLANDPEAILLLPCTHCGGEVLHEEPRWIREDNPAK